LATASFSNETSAGWQVVNFASPVPVTAGQRYVASYFAPRGCYASAGGFFTTAYTRGDLTVPVNGGVYTYGTSRFPASTYNATNYYVDLTFRPETIAPPPPDTRAPVLSGVVATAISQTSAVINWSTDEPANTQVAYGKTAAYGTTTALNPALTTSHSQQVSGLTPGTAYRYQVRSADASGNLAASSDAGLTTATPGTFNPGNPNGTAAVPAGMGLEDVSAPDQVIGNGTASSCTSAAVVSAVTAGGVITFKCGSDPRASAKSRVSRSTGV